jgi:hypothetical protein
MGRLFFGGVVVAIVGWSSIGLLVASDRFFLRHNAMMGMPKSRSSPPTVAPIAAPAILPLLHEVDGLELIAGVLLPAGVDIDMEEWFTSGDW